MTTTSKAGQKMPPKLRLKLANESQNLMARVKLNPQIKKFNYYLLRSDQVSEKLYSRLISLFESLMRTMYEKSSWGWNEEEKMGEFKHGRTRILIVTQNETSDPPASEVVSSLPDENEQIIGFMNFRFETGANKEECALYVYELHVDVEHQRQGLGEELMRMARLLACDFKMDKIMLTVFRFNDPALKFYNKLKFVEDKSSPAKNESDYIILSSKLKT